MHVVHHGGADHDTQHRQHTQIIDPHVDTGRRQHTLSLGQFPWYVDFFMETDAKSEQSRRKRDKSDQGRAKGRRYGSSNPYRNKATSWKFIVDGADAIGSSSVPQGVAQRLRHRKEPRILTQLPVTRPLKMTRAARLDNMTRAHKPRNASSKLPGTESGLCLWPYLIIRRRSSKQFHSSLSIPALWRIARVRVDSCHTALWENPD